MPLAPVENPLKEPILRLILSYNNPKNFIKEKNIFRFL